ncbi:sugar transferase [Sphingomonas sp. JC676]|uniref:sugar transferase n=1 Tax=Sphingomonas sp. JC676 TaxID=2768065 RepID=UPI001657B4E4|nr:sugar transferase [Sphingomonas sp. JC676]MBC9031378.1 sugar transferase [Sphingomonas sp. JC676]
MKVIILASLSYSLINFRGALISAIIAEGHEVVACAPDDDPETAAALSAMGARYRRIPMDRTGVNPLRDLATLRRLVRLIRTEVPEVVLAYTQKPIIYGGLATRIAGGQARFHAMVSGLGHVYSDIPGLRHALLRRLVSLLYRIAIARASAVIVFNRDDDAEMRRHDILRPNHNVVQVAGSGVDIARFSPSPATGGPPAFLMIARLMRDKGLLEFVEAARLVRARFPDSRFRILGPLDTNPTGITLAEIRDWEAVGDIEYLGETRNVLPHLADASVFVLPTYYREGLPRTILEAMACGNPVITTDTPGCRDAVTHGRDGFLVPPRDAPALAEAMVRFIESPELTTRMGGRARETACRRFDVTLVNAHLLAVMGLDKDRDGPRTNRPRRAIGDFAPLQVSIAALAALGTLPLMAIVAVVVLSTLGTPILFRQHRAGAGGRVFVLAKFRTMRTANDIEGRPLPDAARLTATSRVLRRARLDELPGLWNVIRGQMNLVGPRPLLPETVVDLGEGGTARGKVKPGLTGWAQVNGNALLSDKDKLALDLWYIEHRSVRLDLEILVRTVAMLVGGERINTLNIERGYAGTLDRRR